jgi:multiple sugar transport system ATP-binding protein
VTTIYVTHDQIEAMTLGDTVAVMRSGVVQQVGAPQALFERPANLFVAAFIGSPAMNLVEAVLRPDDGLHVEFGSFRLRLPDRLLAERPALRRYEGRKVVLGIRPEDLEDASVAADAARDGRMGVDVDLRETLGRQAYIHFRIDASPVLTEDIRELAADTDVATLEDLSREAAEHVTHGIAVVSARSPAQEGGHVELAVDTSELHFFDPATGHAIYGAGVDDRA